MQIKIYKETFKFSIMKNKITLFTLALFLSVGMFAQAPEAINYQAVARDGLGNPMISQVLIVIYEIRQGSSTGPVVYSETQSPTTNQFGLFTTEIGNGTPTFGTFSGIAWGTSTFYLQVTVNGNALTATQLLSVPYALFSKTSGNGPPGLPGNNSLANATTEAPGAICANGGTMIDVGLDDNPADGTLQAIEIDFSYYVCNGLDGVANNNDTSATNELQTISVSNDTVFLSNGGFALLPNAAGDNWGTDVVNTSGANISGDGTIANPLIVIDAVNDADFDPTNEIQDLTISGNYIGVTGGIGDSLSPNAPLLNQVLTWNGSAWVAQNPGSGADNWGSQVVITDATLSGNGTVGTPLSGFDGQYSNLTGSPTNVSSFTNDVPYLTSFTEVDGSVTNEIQTLSFVNPNLSLTNGGGTVNLSTLAGTDNQDLTFAGNTLSLTNDATPVNLSLYLDNTDAQTLSYTSATQNLSISGGNAVILDINDADNNPANEYNTSFLVNGANLELTDGGATRTVPLSSLAPNDGDWTISSPDMWSGVAGNVGIGITPLHKLDVSGDINLNGVYRIDGTIFLDNKSTSTLIGATGNTGLTGLYNTIVGELAGTQLTSGVRNTLIGRGAGNLLTTESDNILIGTVAGQGLTVGVSNVMIGNYAGWAATNTGADNTFVGHRSGMANTLGSSNTFIGRYAGFANTTGANNTTLGYNSGDQITAGSNNTYIGYNADGSVGTLTNATAIGANANVSQSNAIVLGNGADVGIRTSAPASALDVNGQISMQLGANAGYVPVSDANGLMTWTDPTTMMAPTLWTAGSGTMFPTTLTDQVGIGTNSPLATLDVITSTVNRGSQIQNSFASATDKFGVYANASGGGVGDNIGGWFDSFGAATGTNYGVAGQALGSGPENRAVFGSANGGTLNWAGYFDLGNVFIQNSLGINTTGSPSYPLHVEGNTQLNGVTQMNGSSGLAATLKVFGGLGSGVVYVFDGSGVKALSVFSGGQVGIGAGPTGATGILHIQDNDGNTTGASGSHINIQNLANATNTTAGLRFRTGGSTAVNGDSHYKGGIFFEDGSGSNGEGDMIFAVNNVGSSANVTTADAAMTINTLGNIGIGTTFPNSKLHVNETTTNPALRVQINGTTQFIVANNGNVALYNDAAPAFELTLNANSAAKPTSSAWTVSSDARLKKDIKPYKGGLQDILKIKPVWFTYNGKAGMPNETGVGVIAQDLQKVAPYMVNTWTYTEGSMDENNPRTDGAKTDYLGVDNGAMTYMLINAVKEQQKMIEELKKEIELLKNK
jgi:hypothetical protein